MRTPIHFLQFLPTRGLTITAAVVAGMVMYRNSVGYGFSQDDFIHLTVSRAGSLGEVLQFFNPFIQFPDVFFYRPLTTQLYFWLLYSLFGLNPVVFHVAALVVHGVGIILFYQVVKQVWQDTRIAVGSAMLYAISAIHFLSLYYISAFQQLVHTALLLAAVWLHIRFVASGISAYRWYAVGLFFLALLAKETSVLFVGFIVPVTLLYWYNRQQLPPIRQVLWQTIPYWVVLAGYVGMRLIGFTTLFTQGGYAVSVHPVTILQNLKWYVLWTFGVPELLASYPSLSSSSLVQFGNDYPEGWLIVATTLALLVVVTFLFISQLQKMKMLYVLAACLWLAALLPVVVISDHRYPHYLDLAYLGFLPLIIRLGLRIRLPVIGVGLVVGLFVCLQLATVALSEKTHWTVHRAVVAEHYRKLLQTKYPGMPNDAVITFTGSTVAVHEVQIALGGSYAVQVWYPDSRVTARFVPDQAQIPVPPGAIIVPVTVF